MTPNSSIARSPWASDADSPFTEGIAGLVPAEVGAVLYELASQVPADLAIVELGSYRGLSTCYLAAGAKAGAGAKVYAIDAWDLDGNIDGRFGFARAETREAFEAQLRKARLRSRVEAIQSFSAVAGLEWEGPTVGLLYIDADHSEEAVYADYEAWREHVAMGGVVVFDDLDTPKNPGVRRAIERHGLDFEIRGGRLAVVNA